MAELDYAEYLINRLNFITAKCVTNAKRDFFQVPSEAYIPRNKMLVGSPYQQSSSLVSRDRAVLAYSFQESKVRPLTLSSGSVISENLSSIGF